MTQKSELRNETSRSVNSHMGILLRSLKQYSFNLHLEAISSVNASQKQPQVNNLDNLKLWV